MFSSNNTYRLPLIALPNSTDTLFKNLPRISFLWKSLIELKYGLQSIEYFPCATAHKWPSQDWYKVVASRGGRRCQPRAFTVTSKNGGRLVTGKQFKSGVFCLKSHRNITSTIFPFKVRNNSTQYSHKFSPNSSTLFRLHR